jgi:hypothetical protein
METFVKAKALEPNPGFRTQKKAALAGLGAARIDSTASRSFTALRESSQRNLHRSCWMCPDYVHVSERLDAKRKARGG